MPFRQVGGDPRVDPELTGGDCISHLAFECLGIPQVELENQRDLHSSPPLWPLALGSVLVLRSEDKFQPYFSSTDKDFSNSFRMFLFLFFTNNFPPSLNCFTISQ